MKKFLSVLIAFFAFALVSPQVISAAEIPDIRSLNEAQIKFSRVDEVKGGKGHFYAFDVLDKKGKEYLAQYADFLINKLGYTVSKAKKNEYCLIYSGEENILPITHKKIQYHVWVLGGSDWLYVYFANGIDMTTLKDELAQYGSLDNYELLPIPDLRLLNQSNIKLEDVMDFSSSSEQYCTFECTDKKGREYIAAYVNYLTNERNFTVIKHKEPHGLFAFEDWELVYGGTGNFSPKLHNKHDYHVDISGNKDLVFVHFIDGLTMVTQINSTSSPAQPAQTTPNQPNQNAPATNDGADVPDFGQVGVPYDHNQHNGDGSITYIFKASGLSESRADEFVNQYISLLTSNNFVQTSYDKQKFSERVSKVRQSETWIFDYNGSKSISGLSDGKALHIKRVRNPQTGDTSFEIRVAKDLIFAGNYERPAPPPPGKTTCSACGGSGRCNSCGGDGYYWDGSGVDKPCGSCRTSGKCVYCDGTGYR